jgi:hypothetical protein
MRMVPLFKYTFKLSVNINVIEKYVILDVTPCGSRENRSFGGKCRFHYQDNKNHRSRNYVSSNQQPKHAEKIYYN